MFDASGIASFPGLASRFAGIVPLPGPTASAPPRASLNRTQQLLALACAAGRAVIGGVGFLSAEGELLEHTAHNISEETATQLWRSRWIAKLIQVAAQQPVPTRVPDLTAAYPELIPPAGLPPLGPVLAIPLSCLTRGRGCLYLARSPEDAPFTAQDEETLTPLSNWLGNRNVIEETFLLSQLRLVNQVAPVAAGSLDLSSILSLALRELGRHLPRYVCAVWLTEGEPTTALSLAEVSVTAGDRATQLGLAAGMKLDVDQTPFAGCLSEGQALYADLSHVDQRAAPLANDLAGRGATFSFAVPLRAGDGVVGVLQSICTFPGGFTSEQIQLLYLIADLLGPAISNCRLYTCLKNAYETLRVTQTQLVQAEKMRALGQLAGGMAHEFNNSLCGVLGFIDLALMNKSIDAACKGYLDTARTCAMDAAETVKRVQDFARQRNNEGTIQRLDLSPLARQTVSMIRHKWENLAQARGAPVTVNVHADDEAWISGNPVEMREVLTNLVFNAVDAMPQGGTITVKTWTTAEDVFLTVQDTGTGIPEAIRARLFEPFLSTKGEQGNGLGLSITFGIVKRHHGDIAADSAAGRGTTFTVRLPRAADAGAREDGAFVPAARLRSIHGLRVLVIEDEESVRRYLATGLSQLGHSPRLASSGREGLAAFDSEPFDVVLTDLGLPEISGEEVARTIGERSPGTPVILLTGWAEQIKVEPRPMAGVSKVLGKPVTLQTLANALSSVCQIGDAAIGN